MSRSKGAAYATSLRKVARSRAKSSMWNSDYGNRFEQRLYKDLYFKYYVKKEEDGAHGEREGGTQVEVCHLREEDSRGNK